MPRCIKCRYFESFREAYFDAMEPDEYGFCKNPKNEMDRAGSGEGCEYFEQLD